MGDVTCPSTPLLRVLRVSTVPSSQDDAECCGAGRLGSCPPDLAHQGGIFGVAVILLELETARLSEL